MLNRCWRNPFTRLKFFYNPYIDIIPRAISNTVFNLKSTISSLPVQVCFCNDHGYPSCINNYQPPTVKVMKGETFNVSLVIVDQVDNPLDANINSYLLSHQGAFDEDQQTQSVSNSCTNLTFNIISSNRIETLVLYADGPCANSQPSARFLNIIFSNCTCPVGFEPSNARWQNRCKCVCDSRISSYITLCNISTSFVVRVGTNSWITYINDTDNPGFVTHPNCPFHYCHNSDKKISINFNVFEGADAQCAHFHRGVLCGPCQQNFSLSLGSSRCLPCYNNWPAMTLIILLTFIITGVLLVAVLLALNLTVAVGLINGFNFYSNIITAASSAYFSSSRPSFPTVFVAWLHLDIGFDVCFIDGLDAYIKIWLQLAFPVYIISLVFLIIICGKYFSRFAAVIGKRDPVSTLATLILLSYAKLLTVTISVLSFAVLDYPDGTRSVVWLLDGSVKYCQGKHMVLFIAALLIILIGVPYTALLFLWQWLVCLPKWRIFRWTRNTKLNAFISTYHVPYRDNYRYWTGLLLLIRVVLYIAGAVTVSKNPQVSLLMTIIVIGGLLLHKGITRVYIKLSTDIVETAIYLNILILAAFTLFEYRSNNRKQTAVIYMSTVVTFILLIGVVVYQVMLLVRKKKVSEDIDETQSSAIIELSIRQQTEASLSSNRYSETPYRLMPYESN